MRQYLVGAVVAALLHITPTVILVKRPDAVAQLLPGADQFFARELHLSSADAHRLHAAVDWTPGDGVLTFYSGRRAAADVGVLTFVRVDTPHGPVEVAVSFGPDRSIRGVVVTKATVETRPWVLEALHAGLTDHYRGLKPSDAPAGGTAIKAQVGDLAEYMALEIDKGVARALVAYRDFYVGDPTRSRPG
jgi:hypothetical protein